MKTWNELLTEEDLQFIKRFLLASGSLKELAKVYGITYPTIRLRLDRLIEKLKVLDDADLQDEFERVLRAQYAEGRFNQATFEALIKAHNSTKEKKQ